MESRILQHTAITRKTEQKCSGKKWTALNLCIAGGPIFYTGWAPPDFNAVRIAMYRCGRSVVTKGTLKLGSNLAEPETDSTWQNYLKATIHATKYMSETHKLTSAEPLGEQAMLVTTRTLGLGNRSTLSEPENSKI